MSSVTLGMTTKGINSTSRQMSAGVTLDCKMKDPVCGLHSPILKVKGLDKAYNNYNFAIWRGRYYWVDEILFLTNDIQEVHMHLDPLATFKGAIDDTNAFVLFADEAHKNHYCDDFRWSPELDAVNYEREWEFDVMSNIYASQGCIIMRYMDCSQPDPNGGATDPGGGVKTIALTNAHFAQMLDDLNGSISGATADQLAAFFGGQGSWRENIFSCIWVPFNYDSLPGTETTAIRIGGVPLLTTRKKYLDPILYSRLPFSLPITLTWNDFDNYPFLKNPRWTTLQFITPFGYTDIKIDDLTEQTTMYVNSEVCVTTGDVVIKLVDHKDNSGEVYAVHAGNVAIDMMSQLGTGRGSAAGDVTATLNMAKLGISIGAAIMGGGTSVTEGTITTNTNTLNSTPSLLGTSIATRDTSTENAYVTTKSIPSGINPVHSLPSKQSGATSGNIGGNSGCSALLMPTAGKGYLIRKTLRPAYLGSYLGFCGEYGFPANRYMRLGDVEGYLKCSGAFIRDVPGATPADIVTINSFLNNGIVIEP